jgi:hypothetical protein
MRLVMKARDVSKLIPKKVTVARGGRTFQQTVYVRAGEEPKKERKAAAVDSPTEPEWDGVKDDGCRIGSRITNEEVIARVKEAVGHIKNHAGEDMRANECAVIYGAKGATTGILKGDKTSVRFDEGAQKALSAGCEVFIHNHPSYGKFEVPAVTFSPEDILMQLRFGMSVMVAISPNHAYIMESDRTGGPMGPFDYEEQVDKMNNAVLKHKGPVETAISYHKMTYEAANKEWCEGALWKDLEANGTLKRWGLRYRGMIKWK